MLLELFLFLFFIFEFFYTLCMTLKLMLDDGVYVTSNIFKTIFSFVTMLYKDRNVLGYILSTIVVIVTIPSFLLAILVYVILLVGYGFMCLWDLGKVNNK